MYYGDNGPYEDTGFLRTPIGDYAGDLKVTFRARLLDDSTESDVMAVIINSTSGRLEARTITVGNQWQEFSAEFTEGLFSGCLVEFSMLKEKVLIDDIRITSVQTSIPAPEVLPASDFTSDGFTANWLPSVEADSYSVTIYERDVKSATSYVDFEDLNLTDDGKHIDPSNPGFPEGWTFGYGNYSGKHVSDQGYEGSQGIVFAAKGDGFITPEYDRPIRDFSFFAAHPSGSACFSQIRFACLVGDSWTALGNIDIERISKDGDIIDLSSKLPDGVRQIQMTFNQNLSNDVGVNISIVVDHIKVMTEPSSTAVINDINAKGTSAKISGLDAETDYSYTVKALNDKFTSAPSREIMAAGLASPTLLPASEVGETGFTASWQPVAKAEGYMVSNYKVYTAPEDEQVILLYENFDKVTQGTLSNPYGLYNSYRPSSLDQYTITPGWLGLSTYLVKGMLGTRSFFTAQGSIQTPPMNLSGDDGRFSVKLSIVGDTDAVGDSLVVQAGARVFKRQLISAHSKPIEMTFDFDCGEQAMPLLIYSYGGKPFYIDEMAVTQNFKKGQQSFTELETKAIGGNSSSSATFSHAAADANESFAYRVFAYRDFYGSRVYSVSDVAMHVGGSAGIDDVASDDSHITVSTEGLELTIVTSEREHIEVFGVNGQKIAGRDLAPGTTSISLPSAGLYLVVSRSGFTRKILVN